MALATKIIVGAVILSLLAGFGFYLAQDLSDISLDRFAISGLSAITTESFTFTALLEVTNPSRIPVPVRTIEYELTLEETGEIITTGTLPSFTLSAASTTETALE